MLVVALSVLPRPMIVATVAGANLIDGVVAARSRSVCQAEDPSLGYVDLAIKGHSKVGFDCILVVDCAVDTGYSAAGGVAPFGVKRVRAPCHGWPPLPGTRAASKQCGHSERMSLAEPHIGPVNSKDIVSVH